MASTSYPSRAHNAGAVTEPEYERLQTPVAADGLIGRPTDPPLVYADGVGTRLVKIRAGRRALVRGFHYDSGPEEITLGPLPANTSSLARLDLIVLRLDRSTWTVTEKVVTGTPGFSELLPVTSEGPTGVWELPVAEVTVTAGASTVTAAQVKNRAWYVGDDGVILCQSATRPPHQAGRRIWQTDTGRMYVSTGSAWWLVAEDSGVASLVLASGFSASPNTLHRRNGLVFMQLSVRRPAAAIAANSVAMLATVPDGFRPPYAVQGVAVVPSGQQVCTVAVQPTGAVNLSPGPVGINPDRTAVVGPMTWPVAQ